MGDEPIIDLQLAPPAGRAAAMLRRSDIGGRRWAGMGLLPPDWSKAVAPAVLAVVMGVAGALLSVGVGGFVPRAARPAAGLAAAALAGIAAVTAVTWARRRETIRVVAYENGLVFARDGEPRVIRWADVTALAEQRYTRLNLFGQPVGRGHTFRFSCCDGSEHELEVGGIEDSNVLAGYVHQGTLEYLVPRAEADLAAARPVAFGPLAATPPGLMCGRDVLMWDELESVEVVAGRLVVARQGGRAAWYDGPTWVIPNVHLLLDLIDARFCSREKSDRDGPARSRCSLLDRYQSSAGTPRSSS